MAEQQNIYDQGRTSPGAIVTNAKPGDSYHNYGLAFDVVPVAYKTLPDWNPAGPLWQKVGAIGKSFGLEWGGDWTPAKRDLPHFQLTAAPLAELKAYWEKFKTIMPIEISPTAGGGLIILLIIGVYWFFLRPALDKHGI